MLADLAAAVELPNLGLSGGVAHHLTITWSQAARPRWRTNPTAGRPVGGLRDPAGDDRAAPNSLLLQLTLVGLLFLVGIPFPFTAATIEKPPKFGDSLPEKLPQSS
jgi:hypothetical protein